MDTSVLKLCNSRQKNYNLTWSESVHLLVSNTNMPNQPQQYQQQQLPYQELLLFDCLKRKKRTHKN